MVAPHAAMVCLYGGLLAFRHIPSTTLNQFQFKVQTTQKPNNANYLKKHSVIITNVSIPFLTRIIIPMKVSSYRSPVITQKQKCLIFIHH